MEATTTLASLYSRIAMSARTGGESLSEHVCERASAMRRASNPFAGSKSFFSDSPSTIMPPDPFANAEIVSAMVDGIFPTDSFASTDWLSLRDDFN